MAAGDGAATDLACTAPPLAQVSDEAASRAKLPEMPSAPVRRDGMLSVKPNNLQCDDAGRNCKFVGPTGTAAAGRSAGGVPDGKFLREDLELLKGAF